MTMTGIEDADTWVKAVADPHTGVIDAVAIIDADTERVFRAMTTKEVCDWWVRPGVFDTREWAGDLTEGGKWFATGIGGGRPYRLDGEFVEIKEPHRLVYTWMAAGAPGEPARVAIDLTSHPSGVHVALRHTGIMNPQVLENTRAGWVTSFERLQEIIVAEEGEPG